MLEVRRRGEDRGGDRGRRLVVSVSSEAGGDQGVVVRPDRPGVVAQWVVAALAGAERADAPAGVELSVEEPLGGAGRLVVVEDSRPQQMTDVGGQAVHLAFVAVEGEGVVAAIRDPEVASERRTQILGAAVEAGGKRVGFPSPAGEGGGRAL